MAGSETRAWNAETATNMMVFVNVEKMCDKMTEMRYHEVTPCAGNITTVNWATRAAPRRPIKPQHHKRMGVYF